MADAAQPERTPVDWVVCAAGAGTRFRPLLGDLPKPLIRLRGRALLHWSLRSLPMVEGDTLVVITQAVDRIGERLGDELEAAFPSVEARWIELTRQTRGQLETAISAESCLRPGAAIAIYNCDTYFQSDKLLELVNDPSLAGIVPCSREPGDAWSFCEVDDQDHVLRIAEKQRVGPWATTGLYFFRDAGRFLQRAHAAVERGTPGELYVAQLYQEYVDAGERVRIDRVADFRPMGTPEQVEHYWGLSPAALRGEND
jgi:NDP-sugar pyrophosphorylase family protein